MSASTKHGAVMDLLSRRPGFEASGKRQRPGGAPVAVRALVLAAAQLPAQHVADVAGKAHAARRGVDARASGGVVVERDGDVLHALECSDRARPLQRLLICTVTSVVPRRCAGSRSETAVTAAR